jgi:uncharacterized small protein (DUF1192 family)
MDNMDESIKMNKTVFNKVNYLKTIDTSIRQLGVKTIQEQIEEQPTTEDFFNLYQKLFYDIPERGEFNSHEFLIKSSSEYINFDEIDQQILLLQDEISQLRLELLQTQKDLAEAKTQ